MPSPPRGGSPGGNWSRTLRSPSCLSFSMRAGARPRGSLHPGTSGGSSHWQLTAIKPIADGFGPSSTAAT
eukprot:12441127-Alexandrium_andersonii.AAC.1